MQQILVGAGMVILYFVIAAGIAIICRLMIKIPDELFRKILHCILLFSLLFFVFSFRIWWHSALVAIVFAAVVYPILVLLERIPSFSKVTTERKKGELKSSLLLVFSMFAVVIAVCWGWLGDKYLVLASVYAWGFGDAAAALIGKKFGKHKLKFRYLDGKKSLEGSLAMGLTAFISVVVILGLRGGMPLAVCIFIALPTAVVSAVAELYSREGMDTVICPLCSMAILVLLVHLFGGMV